MIQDYNILKDCFNNDRLTEWFKHLIYRKRPLEVALKIKLYFIRMQIYLPTTKQAKPSIFKNKKSELDLLYKLFSEREKEIVIFFQLINESS